MDYVFLFTDLEGSSRLWESEPERMRGLMARHDALLREAVAKHAGTVVKMAGDGVHAVFGDARHAVAAAVDLQFGMRTIEKEARLPIRVRCGLHAGPAEQRDQDFYGATVNRAARLANAANGGQIVLSAAMVERVQGTLQEPLGLLPLGSVRLRDLSIAEAVHQLTHPQLQSDFPPLRSLSTNPNNLPALATSFVGRYKEVGQVRELFGRGRIVTLAGAGGIGKTRLALQSAAYLLDRYPDGVWFVELATLQSGDALPAVVLGALGVAQRKGDLVASLADHLKSRHALIVLDNCEHVIDDAARLADTLVKAAPGLHLLATSRETLDIDGEQVLSVPTLALPDPDHAWNLEKLLNVDSVRLFLERALAHRPDFQPGADDAAALARIAYRLDGIPLAIELAAARLRTLSLAELNRGLDDRFGTLTTGTRVALPRHKTLRGLVDWSYQLLEDDERALFNALSIFIGGWTLESARAVCGAAGFTAERIADVLGRLVDKSLAIGESASGPRYRMLETLREYGAERLDDAQRAQLGRAHADWILAIGNGIRREIDRGQVPTYEALEPDLANARAAFDWLEKHAPRDHLQLAYCVGSFWLHRGMMTEGRKLFERTVELNTEPSPELARVWHYVAGYAYSQSDQAVAAAAARRASAMFRDLGDIGSSGHSLGMSAHAIFVMEGHAASRALLEEAIELMLKGGRMYNAGNDLCNLANNCLYAGEVDDARRFGERGGEIAAQLKRIEMDQTYALHRGQFCLVTGDYASAETHFRHLEELARTANDLRTEASARYWLGLAYTEQGRHAEAWIALAEGIQGKRRNQAWLELVNAVEAFALLLARMGRAAEAATLLAAMSTERERIQFPVGAQAKRMRLRVEDALAGKLLEAERGRADREGARLSREEALAYLLALPPPGAISATVQGHTSMP